MRNTGDVLQMGSRLAMPDDCVVAYSILCINMASDNRVSYTFLVTVNVMFALSVLPSLA